MLSQPVQNRDPQPAHDQSGEGVSALKANLKLGLAAVAGLILVWQITARTLASALAVSAPETALLLQPDNATALLTLADRRIEAVIRAEIAKATPGAAAVVLVPEKDRQLEDARLLAERALASDPLRSRALRILGQVADLDGASPASDERIRRTAELMTAAVNLNKREVVAAEWLMRYSLLKQDYEASARYADIVLRARPGSVIQVMPTLARMTENTKAFAVLVDMLARQPRWRIHFMSTLPGMIRDPRIPLNIMLALKDKGSPATAEELKAYMAFLNVAKLHDLAYYTWLQFLPPEQLGRAGDLFNGDFSTPPSGLPFDWVIEDGVAVKNEIRPNPDEASGANGKALRVLFLEGRPEFRGVYQQLHLGPGQYVFKVQYKGGVTGRKGLEWSVACVGEPNPEIGKAIVPIGTVRSWVAVTIKFSIPATGCAWQQLRLDRHAVTVGEQLIQGELWFKSAEISRVR